MTTSPDTIHDAVRNAYGKAAVGSTSCCGSSCGDAGPSLQEHAEGIGYSPDDLAEIPDEANLGLGCGNPTAIAGLRTGETVLDLGSGAGMDAFLAAAQVGATGRVVGVDMTPEMLARARRLAVERDLADRVEFRQGLIEDLPVTDCSVDVVLSNCVINLSPDKRAVFGEAFRVLTPGGRLAVSDIVLSEALPAEIADKASLWVGCVAGASLADEYLGAIEDAGFVDVRWTRVSAAPLLTGMTDDPTVREMIDQVGVARAMEIAGCVWSYKIEARKP